MRMILKLVLILIAIPLFYVGGNILYAIITKFKPATVEDVKATVISKAEVTGHDSLFTFFTWNVGYSGLGAETDFFYDQGKMVITPEAWVRKYFVGITSSVAEQKGADFIFLQEVDRSSKRSYSIDMEKGICDVMPDYSSYFAVNYDVKYLPFPWTEPLGKILGGLQTLTNRNQVESKRIALPGITDFPRKLFYLERCLMVQRMKLSNGKELVTVNAHLEAYDDGGVKRAQMKVMKELLEQEYTKGNYVVIGGDWNIAPPDFNVHKWEKEKESDPLYLMNNDSTYIKDWKFVYDSNIPTNRKNSHAFNDKTFTTVIDYFYVSPNVEVVEVKGHDFGFKNSDHNPVSMKVRLK